MNVAVYGGSTFGDRPEYLDEAVELGRWIGERGHGMVFGGSDTGLMGAAARSALDHGAHVVGVEPQVLMDRGIPQPEGIELHVVPTVAERRALMIERADAYVAMAGGPGTLEEISEIMSRRKLELDHGPCLFLDVAGFWDPLRSQVAAMEAAGFMTAEVALDYRFFPDAASLCRWLGEWDARRSR